MTARELWTSMAKGHTRTQLSDKQRTYLIDLAKSEKIFDADHTSIQFRDGLIVQIRNAQTTVGAYGGGLVSKVIPGRFYGRQVYLVKFKDTGFTQLADDAEITRLKRDGFDFQILK